MPAIDHEISKLKQTRDVYSNPSETLLNPHNAVNVCSNFLSALFNARLNLTAELLSPLPACHREEFAGKKKKKKHNATQFRHDSAAPTPQVKRIITSVGSLSYLILDGL